MILLQETRHYTSTRVFVRVIFFISPYHPGEWWAGQEMPTYLHLPFVALDSTEKAQQKMGAAWLQPLSDWLFIFQSEGTACLVSGPSLC